MNSDNESLAFVEEDDVSPTPKNAPPVEVPRPRIMGAPSLSRSKSTPAKPPLHHAVTPAAAAAAKGDGRTRPGFVQVASKHKAGKQDTASEFSDNESVNFIVECNSMNLTPIRGCTSFANAASVPATGSSPAPHQLSRKASNSSIQFHSEPGSRSTSPQLNPRLKARGSTASEKALAPPPPNGKVVVANESISFFEQSYGSDQVGKSSPTPASATHHRHSVPTPIAPVAGSSTISNDSIAFQIEDDSTEGHQQQAGKSSLGTPLVRATTTTPSTIFSVKPDHPIVMQSSVADTSHNELVDSSIAFEMVNDPPAVKPPMRRGDTTSPPMHGSATLYNSHVRRSHSAQSHLNSRPNSPSIQFETEHNSDNESLLDQSASQVGARSPSIVDSDLPRLAQQQQSSVPALLMPEVLFPSPTTSHLETGRSIGAVNAPPKKKTIVTNHLQNRRLPNQRQGSTPPSQPPVKTKSLGEEASPTPSTHPPLYQKAALSTPLAAQAAGFATETAADDETRRNPRRSPSLTDHMPSKRKDKSAYLNPPHPQKRRSKESATSETQGASPNVKLLTEVGSTATTGSPPEPPHTGRRSGTSSEDAIYAQSLATQQPQRRVSLRGVHSHTNSVQDYLESQEMENAHHHRGQARHSVRADRVLYREISPPYPNADSGAVMEAAQEAEQWRRFNERQRAELVQLHNRIALARRQDRTVLESSLIQRCGATSGPRSRHGGAPQPTPLALTPLPGWTKTGPGYSGMVQKPSAHASRAQETQQAPSAKSSTNLISPAAADELRRASPQSRPHSARQKRQPKAPPNSSCTKPLSKEVTSYAQQSQAPPGSHYTTDSLNGPAGLHRAAHSPPPTALASAMSSHALLHSTAAAFVADMLGVLWPPRAAVASSKANRTLPFSSEAPSADLYFVNGSRLTASQVDRFLELVRVQVEAEHAKSTGAADLLHSANFTLSSQSYGRLSPTSVLLRHQGSEHSDPLTLGAHEHPALSSPLKMRQRAPLSTKLALLLPKKAVRRSRVMREVFDVMDLKRQGSLVLDLLPALSRLFEAELSALEEARTSLMEGKATALTTLLESAIVSRQQNTYAWRSARGAAGYTPSSGLSQVLSADGARLTTEAQAELVSLTHRLLLLSFSVNVVIPIASASRIPLLDFPTLCMIIYAAVDSTEHEMDSPRAQWREVVQQYFLLLDS
ncbi:hypothetical protein ABL78_0520 [Leptomonas seymouri]|uniref:Uncharacterized protein n=1 Tax=Leptomonas seymouri TaxID=5684 RepID=A0A0N1I1U6_LEPSE|nr:hypothetical protein ABL78_0520 [Leptomonas seymouri]|eukprot:KPI90294.1 hypothetical protein ABL78_0520 [Leptomonas seymouri]